MQLPQWWHDHGTKILGVIAAGAGAAGEALAYIQQLDPKHAALWGVVIIIGAAVVKRGFTNTARADE